MSRKPSFANLRGTTAPAPAVPPGAPSAAAQEGAPAEAAPASGAPSGPASRQGRSLQALMAEAFNDVLRKHGESPLGD